MNVNSLDVVIGAGSAIGRALIERWSREGAQPILAVARSVEALAAVELLGAQTHRCDYSEASLAPLAAQLQEQSTTSSGWLSAMASCRGGLSTGAGTQSAENDCDGTGVRGQYVFADAGAGLAGTRYQAKRGAADCGAVGASR